MGGPANTEHKGMIVAMWVPCVVFAHVFAAFFLLRTFAILYPKAWADFTRKFRRRKQGKRRDLKRVTVNIVYMLFSAERLSGILTLTPPPPPLHHGLDKPLNGDCIRLVLISWCHYTPLCRQAAPSGRQQRRSGCGRCPAQTQRQTRYAKQWSC
jgi:hypothetical protein